MQDGITEEEAAEAKRLVTEIRKRLYLKKGHLDVKELKEIRICDLKPFEGHPYKVIDNEEMDALVESILEHGIMTPLIVRQASLGAASFTATG